MLSKHKMLDNLSKKNHNMWCKRGFTREIPQKIPAKKPPTVIPKRMPGAAFAGIGNFGMGQSILIEWRGPRREEVRREPKGEERGIKG